MNIEQMLRDAIERKTAKILKEEYGTKLQKRSQISYLKTTKIMKIAKYDYSWNRRNINSPKRQCVSMV